MSSGRQNRTSSDRPSSIQAVVEDCLRRRAVGEAVSDESLIDSHPELMPELGQELKKLQLIDKAKVMAADVDTDQWSVDTIDHANSDTGSGRLEVRCPHCHTPMELAADTLLTDLTCESCGSHFSLVDNSQTTRTAEALTTMGRFELLERLGLGGFGTVWKARDTELDRPVAVKIPRRGDMSPEETEKFLREARAAAQLKHPNIVSVYEVGRDGDSVYIVSDFVRGVNLADWLTGQQLTSREAAELIAKICQALHHAHERGVIHRDLKPANIMMDAEGVPHLMDFGLARREAGEVTMTMEGQVLGTPAYMSPEQAQGESHTADRRSDVYAIGAIFFELLTGERPFRGNARMLLHQVIFEEPPSPRLLNGNVPRDLETITLKCLEKSPGRRYESASNVTDELLRYLRGEPIEARPLSRIERSIRMCKRNPQTAALSALVIVALTIGSLVSTVFAIRAGRNADHYRQERDRAEENVEKYKKAMAMRNNELAWGLVRIDSNDPSDAEQAIELSREALELAPETWQYDNTLGLAYIRASQWKDAIDALRRSREHNGLSNVAQDGYLLAMAHAKLGDLVAAERWYKAAEQFAAMHATEDKNVIRYRDEAANLLNLETDTLKAVPETPENRRIAFQSLSKADPDANWTQVLEAENLNAPEE